MRTRHAARRAVLSLALAGLGSACLSTEDPVGLDQPLRVSHGSFKDGKLPGTEPDATPAEGRAEVTALNFALSVLRPGAVNVPLSGRVSGEAYSVGLRFSDLGSGYWVRTVGSEDATLPGELTWAVSFDVSREIEPGSHQLAVVAFDKDGRPGAQRVISEVCVASELPDNFNVCDATREPPAAVASLSWNTDADLDLYVVAPDGSAYSRSNRALLRDGEVLARLDADSNAGCVLDGRRRENFVWTSKPAKGTWLIYANLFDPCQKSAVRFDLTVHRKRDLEDGKFALREEKSYGGELLRAQANGGKGAALYITSIEFP